MKKSKARTTKAPSKPKKLVTVRPGKPHPWRLCPEGEHWVRTHPLLVPSSQKNPEGYKTIRRCHCARNSSGKDQLYPDEMLEIARRHFLRLKSGPCALTLGHANGNSFDPLITGWVKYWNEVFKPTPLLEANLVKALISSESGFDPLALAKKIDPKSARGLMQLTNATRKILADEKGELKNHFLTLTQEELNHPTLNICAGIRWLFHKRALVSSKLDRQATWEEAVFEYKSILKPSKAALKRAKLLQSRFLDLFSKLEKCEKT